MSDEPILLQFDDVVAFLIGMVVGDFLLVELLLVDRPPGINDIGQDEGYQKTDDCHRVERELT